ncbi:acyltransferase family protein [Herbiconiux solani]|uniref:acyltransferase family protein n=1 Tax=Herbiconiux solani TaxID=661329 RepID=UPI000826EBD2|nr:acyltransferase [Herbiconiux solani]
MGRGEIITSSRPLLAGLTGIRALAAAWVILEHFEKPIYALLPGTVPLEPWINAGYLGVEIFFILSGFIIAYNYAERFRRFTWGNYRQFLELRVARIYPVQLATLLLVGVLVIAAAAVGVSLEAADKFTVPNFIANVFMLQAIPPFEAWNGPAWSICAEFGAYLVFPLIALGVAGVRSPRTGFLLSAAICAVTVVALMLYGTYVDTSPTSYGMIWLRIAGEFSMGCFLYSGWRYLGTRQTGRGWAIAAGVSIIAIGIVIGFSTEKYQSLLALPFIALFVLSCAGATGIVGRVLQSRVMIWGGKVSYSFYMTHFIVLMVVGKLLPWESFEQSSLVVRIGVLVAYFVGVYVAGTACYYLVEEPGRKLIRRLVKRSRKQPLPTQVRSL